MKKKTILQKGWVNLSDGDICPECVPWLFRTRPAARKAHCDNPGQVKVVVIRDKR